MEHVYGCLFYAHADEIKILLNKEKVLRETKRKGIL